jgi:hypothetical protein
MPFLSILKKILTCHFSVETFLLFTFFIQDRRYGVGNTCTGYYIELIILIQYQLAFS